MTLSRIRTRISRQIILFNLILIGLLVLYKLLNGFDMGEFSATLTLISSVSAIYVGILFKYIGKSVLPSDDPNANQPVAHQSLLTWIVPVHFGILLLILSLKAFTVITFQTMNLLLAFIEMGFGGAIGYLLMAVYELKEEEK